MANVMFKRGLHSGLFNTNGTPKVTVNDGTFYLTTDTNRLYVGQGQTLVELNKSITIVDVVKNNTSYPASTYTALPTSGVEVGQFYYVKGPDTVEGENTYNGNILAVCTGFDGNTPIWVQVNPDSNDNDHLGSVTVEKGSKNASNQIPYTLTFQMVDKGNVNKQGTQPSVTFYVNASDIIGLIDTEVTVGDVSNKTSEVTTKITDGTNESTGGSFKIKGGSNVTLTKEGTDTIVIDTGISTGSIQNKVAIGTNSITQNVAVNNTNSGDTLTLSGNRGINIDSSGNIGHANSITAGKGTAETAATLSNGGKFTAVTEVNYDAYGHVTSEKYKEITLPTIKAHSIGVDSTDKSKLTFAVSDDNNTASASATSGSVLFHKITVDGTEATINNQDSLGSFYSKTAIDNMMRSLDAFTYQGPITAATDLPDGSAQHPVHNGDTYKVASNDAISINGQTANPGDLVIATGTETNGVLDTPIVWSVVAGGTNTDTTYKTKVTTGSSSNSAYLGIISSTAGNAFSQYATITGDDWINIATTAGEDSGALAFTHSNPGSATGGTFGDNGNSVLAGNAIKVPKITKDAKGHIVSIEDVNVSIPGSMTLNGDADGETVSLKDASNGDHGSITFSSGDLIDADLTTATGNTSSSTLTVSHKVPTGFTADGSTNTGTGTINLQGDNNSRTASIITAISRDDKGHVKDYTTTTLTFNQIDYTLSRTVASNVATISLADLGNHSKGDITINSTSLNISQSGETGIVMDLVWGSF